MLDSETKARIDSARDILVGKVPDPKSQVEQITIALIYKFMDDMDRQSEEMGGKVTFFSGEFKKYAWNHLLDKRLSGHERLLLYAEGIEKMNVNKNIPQLFRDIFKGVFLPYRDPETLNLFLKEINCFSYDHSEQLGNAFEYLLSVMDSQGDAGQFRTPRHIIDFMVAVVDPKKNETVLDPACGTAGFLISSFKHILKHNQNLTPDERAQLMTNFCGYDISPDMVRLSRVNLYLHGFANPVIHEYDALTSEERWDERFDVIMANPPFMTPKGGIRPHKRFAIPAKRSEVLFVDYMAEHLNPGGRAGIIVPEGIIFQSQNAYKALRKMLVENYLWAVVSLPSGVFNPYSGVKTSILFLDRNLAKRRDDILFVKVESDGFDLGAQRRSNGKNDLPEALQILLGRHSGLDPESRGVLDSPVKPGNDKHVFALSVSRKRLLESADINLSGDRYRIAAVRANGKWPMVKLGEVASIGSGDGAPQDEAAFCDGTVPFFRTSDVGAVHISGNLKDARDLLDETTVHQRRMTIWPPKTMLFPKSGASTFLNHRVMLGCSGCVSSHLATIVAKPDTSLPEYLFHLLCRVDAKSLTEDQNYPSLRLGDIGNIEIPLPPLAEQERIVAELEGYRKVIEGARQVIANYRPYISINPDWPMRSIDSIASLRTGTTPDTTRSDYYVGDVNFVKTSEINNNIINGSQTHISRQAVSDYSLSVFPKGTVLMAMYGQGKTRGQVAYLNVPACTTQNAAAITLNESVEPRYLYFYLLGQYDRLRKHGIEGHISHLNLAYLKTFEVPIPPLTTQQAIVAEIEAERKLVEANRELIARMEIKIKAKLAEVWGEKGA